MAIYVFLCEKCEKETEKIHPISQPLPDKTECEHCGAEAKRVISNTNFQLNGSGYYSTDYKKKT